MSEIPRCSSCNRVLLDGFCYRCEAPPPSEQEAESADLYVEDEPDIDPMPEPNVGGNPISCDDF